VSELVFITTEDCHLCEHGRGVLDGLDVDRREISDGSVLHHVGPLAGAALLAGAGGKLLFGALGFALSILLLLRLYRRFHTLVAPALATGAFIVIFMISTLVVSPLPIGSGDSGNKTPSIEQPTDHASHHQK
jgi:hypothetical protein